MDGSVLKMAVTAGSPTLPLKESALSGYPEF